MREVAAVRQVEALGAVVWLERGGAGLRDRAPHLVDERFAAAPARLVGGAVG